MNQRKYLYVTHVIGIGSSGARENDEKCNSEELTKLFAEGWQPKTHNITVKRTMVVHSWVMFKDEPDEDFTRLFVELANAITPKEPTPEPERETIIIDPVKVPTPEPMTFEKALKSGMSGEELKEFGNQLAMSKAQTTMRQAVDTFKVEINPFTPSRTFALPPYPNHRHTDETIVILERAS